MNTPSASSLFRGLAWALVALVAILLLGGCTRNRPPWPTPTPDATARALTPTVAATPSPAGDKAPAPTSLPTAASSATPPSPESGLPPMPGNETPTPAPGTATPDQDIFTYTVQPGDTLSAIARQFGVSVDDLIQHNQLLDPNALRSGQSIRIPGEAPPGLPTAEGVIHIVQPGETLFGIAQQYGVPLDQLAQANEITNLSILRSGQRLLIPLSEGQAPASERRIHVVQAGDTLTALAARYGVTPAAIVAANQLADPNKLVVGMQLIIP